MEENPNVLKVPTKVPTNLPTEVPKEVPSTAEESPVGGPVGGGPVGGGPVGGPKDTVGVLDGRWSYPAIFGKKGLSEGFDKVKVVDKCPTEDLSKGEGVCVFLVKACA